MRKALLPIALIAMILSCITNSPAVNIDARPSQTGSIATTGPIAALDLTGHEKTCVFSATPGSNTAVVNFEGASDALNGGTPTYQPLLSNVSISSSQPVVTFNTVTATSGALGYVRVNVQTTPGSSFPYTLTCSDAMPNGTLPFVQFQTVSSTLSSGQSGTMLVNGLTNCAIDSQSGGGGAAATVYGASDASLNWQQVTTISSLANNTNYPVSLSNYFYAWYVAFSGNTTTVTFIPSCSNAPSNTVTAQIAPNQQVSVNNFPTAAPQCGPNTPQSLCTHNDLSTPQPTASPGFAPMPGVPTISQMNCQFNSPSSSYSVSSGNFGAVACTKTMRLYVNNAGMQKAKLSATVAAGCTNITGAVPPGTLYQVNFNSTSAQNGTLTIYDDAGSCTGAVLYTSANHSVQTIPDPVNMPFVTGLSYQWTGNPEQGSVFVIF